MKANIRHMHPHKPVLISQLKGSATLVSVPPTITSIFKHQTNPQQSCMLCMCNASLQADCIPSACHCVRNVLPSTST